MVCHKLFWPDRRVGDRQRACQAAGCQLERRRRTQASWRRRNPEYGLERRLRERAAAERASQEEERRAKPAGRVSAARRPAPLFVRHPLDRVPWSLAQDEIGVQATDFIVVTARLVLAAAKDQIGRQVIEPP